MLNGRKLKQRPDKSEEKMKYLTVLRLRVAIRKHLWHDVVTNDTFEYVGLSATSLPEKYKQLHGIKQWDGIGVNSSLFSVK